jgi:hypothetical protein
LKKKAHKNKNFPQLATSHNFGLAIFLKATPKAKHRQASSTLCKIAFPQPKFLTFMGFF